MRPNTQYLQDGLGLFWGDLEITVWRDVLLHSLYVKQVHSNR